MKKGLLASIGIHGAVLSIALLGPTHATTTTTAPKLIFFPPGPRVTATTQAPTATAPRPAHKKHRHEPVLGHKVLPSLEKPDPVDDGPDVEVDVPNTTDIGSSAVDATGPIGVTPGLAAGGDGSGTVQVFDSGLGMTPPRRIAGEDPRYTRQAEEAHVSGTVTARCEITPQGTLEGCRIVHGLPFMDQAVLNALATQRFTPVLFQGQPVRVAYVFQFRFELP